MGMGLRAAILALAMAAAGGPGGAAEPVLQALRDGDDGRGWMAVGRLELDGRGFCTATLIAPDQVLTAAHCLYDKATGARFDPTSITFLAGWRNGRAEAYRDVVAAATLPGYVFADDGALERVANDLALLRLDRPIRLPSIAPFAVAGAAATGASVGVVSYARDRAEAPSLQETCLVLAHQAAVQVLSCSVDFGASGAPVFTMSGGAPRIVAVVSAKATMANRPVALGTGQLDRIAHLQAELATGGDAFHRPGAAVRTLSRTEAQAGTGARFVRP